MLQQKTACPQGGAGASEVGAWIQAAGPRNKKTYRPAAVMNMQNMEKMKKRKGGRPAKSDPAVYSCSVNFSAEENARFLTLWEQSGVLSKSAFIKARVFSETFRVIKSDRGTLEYVAKLTAFHAQFRAVGTNYNQVVKLLHTHFSNKKALAMLYKLEKATLELAAVGQQVLALSEEFKRRW